MNKRDMLALLEKRREESMKFRNSYSHIGDTHGAQYYLGKAHAFLEIQGVLENTEHEVEDRGELDDFNR